MAPSQLKHITLPLQAIERIYKAFISPELTDYAIRQLHAELISVISTDTVKSLIRSTKEKHEESELLQSKLGKYVLNGYDQMEKFLLSELKKNPASLINLFPLDMTAYASNENLLLPPEIMQKFYNVRRLFTLLVDAESQDHQEFSKRWLLFPHEEKRSDSIIQMPLFSALCKEVFIDKDRIDFLESIQHITIGTQDNKNMESIKILNNSLIVCKFLMEGLITANILAQLKIKTMRYEYEEKTPNKAHLILFVNANPINFQGKIAKYLKKLFENPFEEFFMSDFCSEDTNATKNEYDKFRISFESANRRIYIDEKLRPFNIYPLILIEGFNIKLNPDYAPFFAN